MNDTTRYLCPLDCGWHHDAPRYPNIVSLMGSSNGEIEKAMVRHMQAQERILREHFEQHPLTEWVAALVTARQERDQAVRELQAEREQAQAVRGWMAGAQLPID